MNKDLEDALDALEDMVYFDKGPTEEEHEEWCNRILPLLKQYGRCKYIVEKYE